MLIKVMRNKSELMSLLRCRSRRDYIDGNAYQKLIKVMRNKSELLSLLRERWPT